MRGYSCVVAPASCHLHSFRLCLMSEAAAQPSAPKRPRLSGPMADESKSDATSWVAYGSECEFPIQNIPFGVMKGTDGNVICTAIGDQVRDWHFADAVCQ